LNTQARISENALELDARGWAKALEKYKAANNLKAIREILLTVVPFAAIWAVMYQTLSYSYLLTALLALPAAGFLVRIFIIQHDCGHGSFLSNQTANRWLGRVLGILTITPYDYWQRSHAIHHASSGNLDHRGMGDIQTLTVEEYKSKSKFGRILYRVYRNPLVLFVIGPAYVFFLEQRLPIGMMKIGWKPWLSTMLTNMGIVFYSVLLIWLVGWKAFLAIQVPVTLLAASFGVWLFFVQHQFEETNWDYTPDWDRRESALHGSSHYDLPVVLRWLSGNIGIHHVHHLCSHIPFYRLTEVIKDFPELKEVSRITLWESFKCVKLALWDEKQYRLLSFRDALSPA
jgi:omega-6 fatty acid desaturase (delta-12 desaturase)